MRVVRDPGEDRFSLAENMQRVRLFCTPLDSSSARFCVSAADKVKSDAEIAAGLRSCDAGKIVKQRL